MKRLLKKFLLLVLSLCVSLALLEALASAYAWWKFGTLDVGQLNDADRGLTAVVTPKAAAFADTVWNDAYLGIVTNTDYYDKRKWQRNNLAGFPLKRDPSKFTVLLVGGSVAQLMGIAPDPSASRTYLEAALDRFDFGNREVVVLNAAVGSVTQPRQAIATLLYADVCDAIICLDGMNESGPLGRQIGHAKLGTPGTWFRDSSLGGAAFDAVGREWQSNQLRKFSVRFPSRSIFLLTKVARDQIAAGGTPESDHFRQMWRLPEDWSLEDRIEWNMDRYKHFIRMMHAMAGAGRLREAYFLQPSPGIQKPLTDQELKVVGPTDYVPAYQHMADSMTELNHEGIPVISLLDAFANDSETRYIDNCHFTSDGNQKLADRIANEVGRLWSIAEKPVPGKSDDVAKHSRP